MQKLIRNINYLWNKFKNDNRLFWDELEEQMIAGDISIDTTAMILDEVKKNAYSENINDPERIETLIKSEIIEILEINKNTGLNISHEPPTVF